MLSKKYALGAFLLLATVGLAQNKTYTVKSGDTLSRIAKRLNTSVSGLKQSNGLTESSTLRLGMKLQVPVASKNAPRKSGVYAVKQGDNDVKIAKKLGVTQEQLHQANPGVKWTRLQLGESLSIPGKSKSSAQLVKSVATGSGTYKVRSGENDWVIAQRLGVSVKQLRQMNQGVNLAKLQIGQVIRVPGKAAVATKADSKVIKSQYAVVQKEGVSLRKTASTGSRKVDSLSKGERVAIIDRDGDWYRVRTAQSNRGWVRGDLLVAAKFPVVAKAAKGTKAPKVADRGTRVARAGKATTGPVGTASTSALLDHAYAMRGTRYVWGGTSRSGVDCSGFTTNVFRSQGISLPRTSRDQSHIGQPVSRAELQPGDLVFFKTARKGYINHVGIYAGDGKFIHSSSSQRQVRIDRLDSGYYSRQLVTARRVVKSGKVAKKAVEKAEEVQREPTKVIDTEALPQAPKPKATQGADEIIK